MHWEIEIDREIPIVLPQNTKYVNSADEDPENGKICCCTYYYFCCCCRCRCCCCCFCWYGIFRRTSSRSKFSSKRSILKRHKLNKKFQINGVRITGTQLLISKRNFCAEIVTDMQSYCGSQSLGLNTLVRIHVACPQMKFPRIEVYHSRTVELCIFSHVAIGAALPPFVFISHRKSQYYEMLQQFRMQWLVKNWLT